MSGRTKLILGNWKMHFTVKQAVSFAGKLAGKTIPEGVIVGIAPHDLAISEISVIAKKTGLRVIAQNAYHQDEGAYTGEISMPMLRSVADYVLVGHSERRHVFGETNEDTRLKVAAAMRSSIKPVLCIGETLVERHYGYTKQVLSDQLITGLANLTQEEVKLVVVAYEPVWAISAGKDDSKHKAAHPDDALQAQNIIRHNIHHLYGEEAAKKIKVLYGGSVHGDNAQAFLHTEGIDGLLVGGASLGVATFWPIVEKASALISKKITVKG